MIVYPEKRAVVVWPHEAPGLTTYIPPPLSKEVNHQGQKLIAVRHGLDESRVLRNLGVKVPSPILSYYDWPHSRSISAPFAAQKETAAFLTLNPRAYVLSTMGTGKSMASLWAYDYLRSCGLAKRLLIVATLSSLNAAWADSVVAHLPHLSHVVLHGSRKKRLTLLEYPADVYIINHDGVEILAEQLRARTDIDAVIIDELADCARNIGTQMWRSLDSVVNTVSYIDTPTGHRRRQKEKLPIKKWVWGLTGTPTPNEPADAYAQARLITPETAPRRYTWFRNDTMVQVSQYRWRPKERARGDTVDATEIVYKTLSPAIRYTLAECVDIPPTVFLDRFVPLTKAQKDAYNRMRNALVVEADAGLITAANAAVKTSKLRQIATGVGYTQDGEVASFDAEPRLAECLKLVQASESGKALVFVPFTAALKNVADYLHKHGRRVSIVYGEVSKNERDRIFGEFQHGSETDVIVCHPRVMAHSLTLTAASLSIWFAPYDQPGIYEQANCRTPRPGQKLSTVIVNIWGTQVEKMIYQRLKNKQNVQNGLLDMIREGRE
jgi:hypothetical protein